MNAPSLTEVGADSISELIALIADDGVLPPKQTAPLREIVWRQCQTDFGFFYFHFWNVETIGAGYRVPMERPFQLSEINLLNSVHEMGRAREVRLKARQLGWTTLAAAYAFWSAYFHDYHPWLIASQGEDEAKGTLRLKIKTPFLMLPKWMTTRGPALLDDNSEQMTFANGSWIMSIASTAKAGRSKSVFGVLLDEFAFVDNADELLTALDPLCYGPLLVFSTANGMGNPFHKTWVESQREDSEWNLASKRVRRDERFHGCFVPWDTVEGRDDKWYQREKRKYRGREWAFYQEYPETPEEAFAKTGRTALPMELLREQDIARPLYRLDVALVDFGVEDPPLEAIIPEDEERDIELWVWEPPNVERDEHGFVVQKPNYVIGCDVAEGLDHGDRTSVTVKDCNNGEYVAALRAHVPVEDLGELLEWLGYWYHTALLGPERNNHGILPLDYLKRANYPRVYRMGAYATQKGSKSVRYGWHTNKATKPKMINDFIRALRDDVISVHDDRLLEEAQTFVADGKGGYGATSGNHDDHVISHLICEQLAIEVGKYPVVWNDGEEVLRMGDVLNMTSETRAPSSALGRGIGQSDRTREGSRTVASFFIPT